MDRKETAGIEPLRAYAVACYGLDTRNSKGFALLKFDGGFEGQIFWLSIFALADTASGLRGRGYEVSVPNQKEVDKLRLNIQPKLLDYEPRAMCDMRREEFLRFFGEG